MKYLAMDAEQTTRLAELLDKRPADAGLLVEPRGGDWRVEINSLTERQSHIITSSGTSYPESTS
jgi:hypothetical protein